jgi:hypothetical protein
MVYAKRGRKRAGQIIHKLEKVMILIEMWPAGGAEMQCRNWVKKVIVGGESVKLG